MEDGEQTPAPIMIVEDELIVARDLRDTLEELGYSVVAMAASGEDAIAKARSLRPSAILMDIHLAGTLDGIQAAAQICSERDIPIVYLTAHSSEATLRRATATEPFGYIVKPFKAAELRCAIEVALHKHELVARLRARERWLATTLRSIGDGVLATDTEKRVKFLNPVAEALTGWTNDEALGRTLDEILHLVTEQDRERIEPPVDRALRNRDIATLAGDAMLVARNGTAIPIGDSAAPIVSDAGDLLGGVMVFRDESESRQTQEEIRQLNLELERRVLERTSQLEAANRELEAFSYSVAHDLRAPLRGIDGFSQILIEEHAARLDPDGLAHLTTLRQAARRMHALIEDLLRLSRAARAELRRAPVDLSRLAREVVARLRDAEPHRSVTTEIADDITVSGDEGFLAIVLENLLGNAWKFTSKQDRATIEVGTTHRGDAEVCFVRDDGIGFDASNASRLFAPFQRFHSSRDFEGTGVGLAIVHRIVQRHGGRIWADSAVGAGTTFYFVL
jgi:PAS domain S-box-containing protein